jgi:hypothetical protein
MKVAVLNKQRNDEAIQQTRDLWSYLKFWRHRLSGVESEDKELEDELKEFDPEDFDEWYATFKKDTSLLLKKAEQFENQIRQINKPRKPDSPNQ